MGYDNCGFCHLYTAEERAQHKDAARTAIAEAWCQGRDLAASDLGGSAFHGACFLLEDGEATTYETTDGAVMFRIPGMSDAYIARFWPFTFCRRTGCAFPIAHDGDCFMVEV